MASVPQPSPACPPPPHHHHHHPLTPPPTPDCTVRPAVYLDNSSLELYHGRLDKRPNAVALRVRWYGPDDPRDVYIERKTHKESWRVRLRCAGAESVRCCCWAGAEPGLLVGGLLF